MKQNRVISLNDFFLFFLQLILIQCNFEDKKIVFQDQELGIKVISDKIGNELTVTQKRISDNSQQEEFFYILEDGQSENRVVISCNIRNVFNCSNSANIASIINEKRNELYLLDLRDDSSVVSTEHQASSNIFWVKGKFNVIGIMCINNRIIRISCSRPAFDKMIFPEKLHFENIN